jgi:hypothetical protein
LVGDVCMNTLWFFTIWFPSQICEQRGSILGFSPLLLGLVVFLCETWVPMGPHQLGSQRCLPSGPDLPEALPTCKWARRPYPQSRRPWKTLYDLIQIADDQLGLRSKLPPRSRRQHHR